MPPSPWIGSTMNAAVRSSMAATAAAVSPKGMNSTPGMRGSTRVRYFSRPVVASAPRVFPWYPPIVEMMRLRPVAILANLRAASTASVPELLKKVYSSPAGAISASSAARSAAGLLKNAFPLMASESS